MNTMKWYNPMRIKDMSEDDRKTCLLFLGIGILSGILIAR